MRKRHIVVLSEEERARLHHDRTGSLSCNSALTPY
jgi:hypothetical protein